MITSTTEEVVNETETVVDKETLYKVCNCSLSMVDNFISKLSKKKPKEDTVAA